MVSLIKADGFYKQDEIEALKIVVLSLPFVDKEFGKEIDNFNMVSEQLQPIFCDVLGEKIKIDEDRSGIFRKPVEFVHFEGFDSPDEWCFFVALQPTTFNLYYHKETGARSALDGYKFNYLNLLEWDYHINMLLEPNEGVFFRPWLFHSFDNGLIQCYRLIKD